MPSSKTAEDLSWRARVTTYILLAHFQTAEDLPDYSARLQRMAFISEINDSGLWTLFKVYHPLIKCRGALYRKRLILYFDADPYAILSLQSIIENGLSLSEVFEKLAQLIGKELCGESLHSIKSYALVHCRSLKTATRMFRRRTPSWLDDGLTTFYARVHDSQHGRVGYIRISRHLGVTFGLGENLFQDLVNIIYEQFLYHGTEVEAKMVFALFDALGDYVLPMELNLYLQKVFYGLGLFAAFISITLAYFGELGSLVVTQAGSQGQVIEVGTWKFELSSVALSFVKYVLSIFLVVSIWLLVRRIVFAITFR